MANKSNAVDHLSSGLILSGGGARAAYQVGVLKAIAELVPPEAPNPFGIISGTSAGAINATALAAYADNFRNAVYSIENVWRSFTPDQVYRTDPLGVAGCAMRWMSSFLIPPRKLAVSLLDNSPLHALLKEMIRFENIAESIQDKHLRALSVTASGYETGHSVAFFQGDPDIAPWRRFQRMGVPTEISLDHLMASSAIPEVFPAIRINREYYGDGAMRQLAPLSPALHLGARKILVVGVSGNRSAPQVRKPVEGYPTHAQIISHMLNTAFLDSLDYDIERLERINNTVLSLTPSMRKKSGISLRPVGCLVISPSVGLDQIAAKYTKALPPSIRFFLHGIGADRTSGSSILSYVLFERGYCNELVELGYEDAMRRREQIEQFLYGDPAFDGI
jgi:NTE family protein